LNRIGWKTRLRISRTVWAIATRKHAVEAMRRYRSTGTATVKRHSSL
jgi:hypothetical protein